MQKDTIEVARILSDDELKKVEKAAKKAHCDFSFAKTGGKTIIVVPKEKAPKVFQNLVTFGVIE